MKSQLIKHKMISTEKDEQTENKNFYYQTISPNHSRVRG